MNTRIVPVAIVNVLLVANNGKCMVGMKLSGHPTRQGRQTPTPAPIPYSYPACHLPNVKSLRGKDALLLRLHRGASIELRRATTSILLLFCQMSGIKG